MSVTTALFLLLIVGSFVAMFSMQRGNASAHGGVGGCCGGHGSHDHQNEQAPDDGDAAAWPAWHQPQGICSSGCARGTPPRLLIEDPGSRASPALSAARPGSG